MTNNYLICEEERNAFTVKASVGLDILKGFTFVCDVSMITWKYTFIGCPRDQIDKSDFYDALLKHFGCLKVTNP